MTCYLWTASIEKYCFQVLSIDMKRHLISSICDKWFERAVSFMMLQMYMHLWTLLNMLVRKRCLYDLLLFFMFLYYLFSNKLRVCTWFLSSHNNPVWWIRLRNSDWFKVTQDASWQKFLSGSSRSIYNPRTTTASRCCLCNTGFKGLLLVD